MYKTKETVTRESSKFSQSELKMHTKRKYNIHKWEFSSFNSIVKMPARYCMDLISTHSIRKSDFCSATDLWIQFCVPHLKNNLWALPSCKQDAFALLSMRLAKAVMSILTISLSCKMIVTDHLLHSCLFDLC